MREFFKQNTTGLVALAKHCTAVGEEQDFLCSLRQEGDLQACPSGVWDEQ